MKLRIEVETRDDVGLDAVVIEVRAEDMGSRRALQQHQAIANRIMEQWGPGRKLRFADQVHRMVGAVVHELIKPRLL